MRHATPPPAPEEIETRLRDCFVDGDFKGVARWLGVDKSSVSRQVNPEEPTPSDVYRCLRFLDACQRVRLELFEEVSAIVLDFIQSRTLKQSPTPIFNTRDLTETINLFLEKADHRDQLRSVRRAMNALREREVYLMMNDIEDSEDEGPMRRPMVGAK